jgi:hypothetical protein
MLGLEHYLLMIQNGCRWEQLELLAQPVQPVPPEQPELPVLQALQVRVTLAPPVQQVILAL